jgi:uncharacterized protein YecE (DUF72 family)
VRLHGETRLYGGGYSPASLKRWARKLRRWAKGREAYVFFDNDSDGRAPFDAMALQEALALRVAEPNASRSVFAGRRTRGDAPRP